VTPAFFDGEEARTLRDEIATAGFEPDPFLTAGQWQPVWGLNLAFGWPLPIAADAYQTLASALEALDPALFVYPHAQSHVTVLTLVNFKDHVEPPPEEIAALETLIPLVVEAVAPVARAVPPFDIEIGPPVLARRALFLPIREPAGVVARFRRDALEALRARLPLFHAVRPPLAVHSTVARFNAVPAPGFVRRFDDLGLRPLGPARVDSLLVTTETRPYMREGAIARAFSLAGSAPVRTASPRPA
jgi:hypothetical protein